MDMDELYNIDQEDDQDLADEAMRNTYKFIIGGCDWDKLPDAFWMLGDPESKLAITDLMDYFISTEEYEKCATLKKILDVRIEKKNKLSKQ